MPSFKVIVTQALFETIRRTCLENGHDIIGGNQFATPTESVLYVWTKQRYTAGRLQDELFKVLPTCCIEVYKATVAELEAIS